MQIAHYQNQSGVWGHSSRSGFNEYIIFCVGQDHRRITAFRSWAQHKGIPFKSLKGCYRGQKEDSFIINARDWDLVKPWTIKEESILRLGHCNARDQRPAQIEYADGRTEELGYMRSCRRAEAFARDGWTYCPTLNSYSACD